MQSDGTGRRVTEAARIQERGYEFMAGSNDRDYGYLKKRIMQITGVDLNAYKENQMKRRLDTLITKGSSAGTRSTAIMLRMTRK